MKRKPIPTRLVQLGIVVLVLSVGCVTFIYQHGFPELGLPALTSVISGWGLIIVGCIGRARDALLAEIRHLKSQKA